jgi:hypothetical protein
MLADSCVTESALPVGPRSDDRVSISITSVAGHPAAALRLPYPDLLAPFILTPTP